MKRSQTNLERAQDIANYVKMGPSHQDVIDRCMRHFAEIQAWTEDDQPLPEDAVIKAAHPTRSGNHALYGEAMRLVGAKRSKSALVALVNWLLNERQKLENGGTARYLI